MIDRHGRNMKDGQPLGQFLMFFQKNHMLGTQRNDFLDIRVIEPAESRQTISFGRIFAVIGNANDPIAQSQGEKSFGHAGNNRNNPFRRRLFDALSGRRGFVSAPRRKEEEGKNSRNKKPKPVSPGEAAHFSKSRHERLGWIP